MINDAPIGIFDSGLGGLTVLKQIQHCLPFEDYIYFGDTAHLPYGSKSNDCIIDYSYNIANFLISKNVKAIIIACNSASSVAKEYLQQQFDIPIFEVITPSVEHAVNVTNNKRIGIIGTETTIKSKIYSQKISNLDQSIYVEEIACPLFVPIIEESLSNHSIANIAAKLYLKKIPKEVDTLILGCTHYPLIKKTIQNSISSEISILDSSIVVADYVKEYMVKNSLLNGEFLKGENSFYISDDVEKFENSIANIMNVFNCKVKKVDL